MTRQAARLRVYIVEDSRAVRELLTEQLNDTQGVVVVGSSDAERDALDGLRATPCDVVILDIKLREGSGFGVLRGLREMRPEDDAPPLRVMFSNFTEHGYRSLAARLGARHFFDKSAGLLALLRLLEDLGRGT